MDCAVCERLATEYRRLKASYGVAVDHLFAVGYAVTDAEYERLKASVENARFSLETAQHELETHQQTHSLTRAAK
jgi:hypothetical protein